MIGNAGEEHFNKDWIGNSTATYYSPQWLFVVSVNKATPDKNELMFFRHVLFLCSHILGSLSVEYFSIL